MWSMFLSVEETFLCRSCVRTLVIRSGAVSAFLAFRSEIVNFRPLVSLALCPKTCF